MLAYVLGRLGRHFESHEIYAAVLASRERTTGHDDPETLRCRHELAVARCSNRNNLML